MRNLVAIIVSCMLLPATWLVVGLDKWTAASGSPGFEIAFVSFGIFVGAALWQLGKSKAWLFLPVVYLLFVIVLPFVELSPVKPAVRAVHEIRNGMTEAQVRFTRDRYFPAEGRFKRPVMGAIRDDVLSFALDPNDGRYDAAIVQVKFSEGKCVSAEFLAD